MNRYLSIVAVILLCFTVEKVSAQNTDSMQIDLSAFQDLEVEMAPDTSGFCTQKVVGLSPSKLISIGYDYQGSFTWNAQTQSKKVSQVAGLRFALNFPVISTYKSILNVGLLYNQSLFAQLPNTVNQGNIQYSSNNLQQSALQFTWFKPLNRKKFLIFQYQPEMNGLYFSADGTNNSQYSFDKLKHSATAIYGFKKNDKFIYGFGITRTYRGGSLLHVPVLLYNRTFNAKWGVEMLLPARGHLRYNLSARNYLMAGYELEGANYYLASSNPALQANLNRSEIRARLLWERSLYKFIWLSIQGGVRVNYRFRYDFISNSNAYKEVDYKLTNPFYGLISINLVSP